MKMLFQDDVDQEEELIRLEASQLSDKERKKYFSLVKQRIKDPDTYAVLNWFFVTGLHHFYLNNWVNGGINLMVFLIGAILILAGIELFGILMILAIFIIELYALFRSQIIVKNYNNQVMRQAIIEVLNDDKSVGQKTP